jgi:hypothetical protein
MVPRGSGVILFTGASASVKGYAQSAPFAMGKFALRGMAVAGARAAGQRHPRGALRHRRRCGQRGARQARRSSTPASLLDPDAIAQTYMAVC